ncbi:DUF5060 domain-containing protein [Engelhardtia mirabilis]|uniref:DUF5060 domain-containing protein n=1 Tax=Engelhardtia mirabilis TaxID=2528011 RepID=A0A518BG50_9BACT|nr:hypothetical protein Pla133_10230 [Planctomycetes bacterium Pla133]QDV00283.1 hypothetical protein Pla86_10220 [Planctomycetes bacterium Pla86]
MHDASLGARTAVLVFLSTALAAASPQVDPKPRVTLSPVAVPIGTTTAVDLAATHADGSAIDPGQFDFNWTISGGSFAAGSGPTDPEPTLEVSAADPLDVQLILSPKGESDGAGRGDANLGVNIGQALLFGKPMKWHPTELWFKGPLSNMTFDSPNPFLDYRLDVTFLRPDGSELQVPGFFDGDGFGGGVGQAWKVRLTPDMAGVWTFEASFRSGDDVAVAADPLAGSPVSFDGASGVFTVAPRDLAAPGFLRDGRLDDVGLHYRRQVDGGFWIKSGADSPENLLSFAGFADVEKAPGSKGLVHRYESHASDWTLQDRELPLAGDLGADVSVSRNLMGALNYLSSVGVNSVYFLPMNLGGDGQDVSPFIGHANTAYDKTHYHIARLYQWEAVFRHAQERGIQLLMVLAETEPQNETWLDFGTLGVERKLFMRELVARFAHHNAIKWCLSEENDYPQAVLEEMAAYLAGLDAYDHAIAVHNKPFAEGILYGPLLGNPDFSATSIQYLPAAAGQTVEYWRAQTAGKPWVIDMDENNPADIGAGPDNAEELRKEVLYDIYFSGGQLEWYLGAHAPPIGGDLSVEDFRTREEIWLATKYAREVLETLPFHLMEPMDQALAGEPLDHGGGEVFALPGEAYAIYLPNADTQGTIQLDLGGYPGTFELAWYDPRSGQFQSGSTMLMGGGWTDLPSAPDPIQEDWVAVVKRPPLWATAQSLSVSAGGTLSLEVNGSPDLAFKAYSFMASASGTSPGFGLSGLTIPLVADNFFWGAVQSPGLMGLTPAFGLLNGAGRATAQLTVPPATSPAIAGLKIWYAWGAGQIVPSLQFPIAVSNPVSVEFVP